MKKLLALLVVWLGLFSSTFALKTPNIMGWTETTGADLSTNYMIIQSGQTQNRISLLNMASIFSGGVTMTGDFYPFSGNDPTKPIYGDFYMAVSSGALNIAIETGVSIGWPLLADLPVITPTAYLAGFGLFKVMITKGWQFFMWEPGQDTQMYFANSTGNIWRKLESDAAQARFRLQPFTGWAMAWLNTYTQWNVNGTIQAGNTWIIAAINAGPDETYVTKGWVNTQWIWSYDGIRIKTNNTWVMGFQVGDAIAWDRRSFAWWEWAYALDNSIVIWKNNTAIWTDSISIWNSNTATAQFAQLYWFSNQGAKNKTFTLWLNNSSFADFGIWGAWAIWESNNIRSYDTFVMWRLNNSTGESNVIVGIDTNFSGQRLYGFWQSLLSTGMDKYIFGQYNLPTSGSRFEFGIGNAWLRSNAMTIMSNGNVNITWYTQLWGNAPSIKMKLLTGTAPSAEGSRTGIAHGLTYQKIISIDVLVSENIYKYPPNYTLTNEAEYSYRVEWTQIYLWLDNTNSALLINAPFTMLITYIE